MKTPKMHFTRHLFDLDSDYRIFYYYDTNAEKIYRHTHNFYELYHLISGHVKYFTAGSSFYLAPGDFLFVNRLEEHFPQVLDFSVPYERMALHVAPTTLQALSDESIDLTSIFSQNAFKVYHYPVSIQNKILSYMNQLMELYNTSDIYGSQILGRSALASLFVLLTQYKDTPSIYSFDKSNKDIQIISISQNYIKQHLHEKISVDELANLLFMNKYYFMHQFKNISGMSVYQFIQKIRMDSLIELVNGGCPIMSATEQCGFKDYPNFYRYFKKEYGCNPSEFFKNKNQGVETP